jgi:hypothetical protein
LLDFSPRFCTALRFLAGLSLQVILSAENYGTSLPWYLPPVYGSDENTKYDQSSHSNADGHTYRCELCPVAVRRFLSVCPDLPVPKPDAELPLPAPLPRVGDVLDGGAGIVVVTVELGVSPDLLEIKLVTLEATVMLDKCTRGFKSFLLGVRFAVVSGVARV